MADTKGNEPLRSPNLELDDTKYERLKYAREVAQKALDDRRDKAWRIFSWASSILLAITAGVIAIVNKDGFSYMLFPHGLLFCFAVFVLAWYAGTWIKQNQHLADNAEEIVGDYERQLGIDTGYEANKIQVGYVLTVRLLAAAAILAILLVAKCQNKPTKPSDESLELHGISKQLENVVTELAKAGGRREAEKSPNPAAPADRKAPLSGR